MARVGLIARRRRQRTPRHLRRDRSHGADLLVRPITTTLSSVAEPNAAVAIAAATAAVAAIAAATAAVALDGDGLAHAVGQWQLL